MGWVGWTEAQTLATDMQSIEIAYRGCHERLSAVAGREIAGAQIDAAKTMTTELFLSMFGNANK